MTAKKKDFKDIKIRWSLYNFYKNAIKSLQYTSKSSFYFFTVNENQFRGNKLSLLQIDMHGIEFNFI